MAVEDDRLFKKWEKARAKRALRKSWFKYLKKHKGEKNILTRQAAKDLQQAEEEYDKILD